MITSAKLADVNRALQEKSRDELKHIIRKNRLPIKLNVKTAEMRTRYYETVKTLTRYHNAREQQRKIAESIVELVPEDVQIFLDEVARMFETKTVAIQRGPNIPASEKSRRVLEVEVGKKLAKKTFPLYARLLIHFSDCINQITKKQRTSTLLHENAEVDNYVSRTVDEMITYNWTREYPDMVITRIDVSFDTTDGKTDIIRVAKYQAENCFINIIRHYMGDKVDKIYKDFPQLKPTTDRKGPIYVTKEEIHKIAYRTGNSVTFYTELGAIERHPWCKLGRSKGTALHIKICNEHATIVPKKLPIADIVYHDTLGVIVPDATNIVERGYQNLTKDEKKQQKPPKPQVQFYTQIEDGMITMHKCFRPSTVTKNPKDDDNMQLAYVFDADQMMYTIFKEHHNLRPISNDTLREIVKQSEHFIGRKLLEPLELNEDNGPVAQYTEVDHNKNYVSYEKSAFYQGFPGNALFPVTVENSTSPAFIVIKSMQNVPTSFQRFYGYDGQAIVLPNPTYQFLLSRNTQIDVDYIIDAKFSKISVVDFANSFDIPEEQKKAFRNSLIGRTITGGLKGITKHRFAYANTAECTQLKQECERFGYAFADDDEVPEVTPEDLASLDGPAAIPPPPSTRGVIYVERTNKTKGLFNFHSYILSYASIFMMQKWADLEGQNLPVVAYNVDALVVKGDYHEQSVEIGGWKSGELKAYYQNFTPEPVTPLIPRQYPTLIPAATKPYTDNTIILGPGGIGKSLPFIQNPQFDQIVLTPTRSLRQDHASSNAFREGFPNTHTAAKYFQFDIKEEHVFQHMRKKGTIPREHVTLVIDEFAMFTLQEWETIRRRAGDSVIIALGDLEQIHNAVSEPVDIGFFHDFTRMTLARTPQSKARQSYQYGCKLDSLRHQRVKAQRAEVLAQWETTDEIDFLAIPESVPEDAKTPQEMAANTPQLVVGTHQSAHHFNKLARQSLDPTCLFPMRTIKDNVLVMMPLNTPNVYWNRRFAKPQPIEKPKKGEKPRELTAKEKDALPFNTAPKGTKYEPAFAITIDSLQGKTVKKGDTLYVYPHDMHRHGCIYTAMTRTTVEDDVKVLRSPIAA